MEERTPESEWPSRPELPPQGTDPQTSGDGNNHQGNGHTASTWTVTTDYVPPTNPKTVSTAPGTETTATDLEIGGMNEGGEANTGGGGGGGGGLSQGTKIAIAVPIAVVGAAIIAIILFFLIRRRRRRSSKPEISTPRMDMAQFSHTSQQRLQDSHYNEPDPEFVADTTSGTTRNLIPAPPIVTPAPPIPTATSPIARRPVPQSGSDTRPLSGQAGPTAVAGTGSGIERNSQTLEWRTSEEQRQRPRSPFDHPLDDDAMSDVSGISVRHTGNNNRGLDDDLSSVSSFGEDDDRPPAARNS